jgi:hypothetical protein
MKEESARICQSACRIRNGVGRSMKKVYAGLPRSGKTTKLINEYRNIVEGGARTENILALVMSLPQSRRWRRSLDLTVTGSIQIFTFWGFAQREILRFWHLVLPRLRDGDRVLQPTFLNAESAHYLMTVLVNEARDGGLFGAIVATSSRIALQVLNNLNQAAINGIDLEEAFRRLLVTCNGDERKMSTVNDALKVARSFRQQCLDSRCLDYSLSVNVYCKYLLTEPHYQEITRNTYRHLIVDNLEEAVPAQFDLITALLGSVENACFSYDPSGGHTRSFGADPELAGERVFPFCEMNEQKTLYGCSEQAAELAAVIGDNILFGSGETVATDVIDRRVIGTEFRAEMIAELGKAVIELLSKGTQPGRIAVVVPSVDKVLEHTLARQLKDAGHRLQNITQRILLSDEPYTQLMINIAALVQPGLGWPSNISSLAYCFHVVLEIDPVRSALLAQRCLRDGTPRLPDLDDEGLRARVGFNAGKRYDRFRGLIERLQHTDATANLFQLIFSEVLAPFVENRGDIVTSRQIIDSALKFTRAHKNIPKLKERSLVQSFLDMMVQGTVAAEAFSDREPDGDAIILTTPLGLFRSGLLIGHQFWVDCSDASWYFKGYSELSNAEIMRQGWDGTWDDTVEQGIRQRNAALRVRGLLYRCQDRVTIVQSDYNGLGNEQQGPLPEIIFDTVVIDR